jgi:hypothetical protein
MLSLLLAGSDRGRNIFDKLATLLMSLLMSAAVSPLCLVPVLPAVNPAVKSEKEQDVAQDDTRRHKTFVRFSPSDSATSSLCASDSLTHYDTWFRPLAKCGRFVLTVWGSIELWLVRCVSFVGAWSASSFVHSDCLTVSCYASYHFCGRPWL